MTYRVNITHSIGDLAADLAEIPVRATTELARVVRKNAEAGNRIARDFASQQHTMHGPSDIHYPKAFSAELCTAMSWEYGPDISKPQGGMKFEWGEGRQSAPHLDLNRSADIIGPKMADDVRDVLDRLFW